MDPSRRVVYEFGPFSFEPKECLLLNGGRAVHLPPKALETLRVLVENAGTLVEKEDLMRAVWSGTSVEEGALVQNIFRLRKALDVDAGQTSLIETVAKRGYRFRGEVRSKNVEASLARRAGRTRVYGAGCAAVLLALVLIWVARNPSQGAAPWPRDLRKLTNNGQAMLAAISADGSKVAYASSAADVSGLWIAEARGRSQARRIATLGPRFRGLMFSPDGVWIEITADNALHRVPVSGGPPVKWIDDVDEPPTFSPDGVSAAFVREDLGRGENAVVLRGNGGAEKVLSVRHLPLFYRSAAWKHDGSAIACIAGKVGGARDMTVVEIPASGGAERLITRQTWHSIEGVSWLPGDKGLLISAAAQPFGLSQIWHIAYPGGDVTRVTNDVLNYRGVDVSKDGQVTTVAGGRVSSLYTVSLAGGHPRQTVKIASSGEFESRPAWMPDGRLVYESSTADGPDIWIMDTGGKNRTQLTRNHCRNSAPSVSGDGRYIVYVAQCDEGSGIWRMDPRGGSAALLVAGREVNSPACSRDGKWVVYESNAGGKSTVWRVPMEGGAAQPLTDKLSRHPVISPDGALVAMYYWDERDSSPRQVVTIPISGGRPHVVAPIDGEFQSMSWAHDGTGLMLLRHTEQHIDIWMQPIDGRPATRVTDFADDETHSFALSADGRTLACARGSGWADVVVFQLGSMR